MSDIQLLQWIYLFLMHQKHVLLFGSPVSQMWNAQGSDERPMTRDTRIALFLMRELVAALRDNDPDLFVQVYMSLRGYDGFTAEQRD